MNKAKRRSGNSAKRKYKRSVAQKWFETEYKALKVVARLAGIGDLIPWHELSALPVLTRYHRRHILSLWVEVLSIPELRPLALPYTNTSYYGARLPFNWGSTHYAPQLKSLLENHNASHRNPS